MIFFISNYLTQMLNFLIRIPDCESHSVALLHLFISSGASICSTVASFHWKIVVMLLLLETRKWLTRFIAQLMTILVLIGTVFMIISEMFHGKKSLSLMLLLMVLNSVCESRLELMYLSLIVNIRSSIIYLHGFLLLVLLPQLIEITCCFI